MRVLYQGMRRYFHRCGYNTEWYYGLHVITRDDDHREKKKEVTTWNVLVSSNPIVQQHGYILD